MCRNAIFSFIIIVFLFAFLEMASYVAGKFLWDKRIIYDPSFSAADRVALQQTYEEYLGLRDPVLGWPPLVSRAGHEPRDASGSRAIPKFPDPERFENCVVIYGDSFTWSAEVETEYAWSNVLSGLLNCRVGNFGVGAYGSDQAYLRYLGNTDDSAPIVFLNHFSENILRNLTQLRWLIHGYDPHTAVNFKPKFFIDEQGSLQLADIPTFVPEEFPDVLADPERYLPDDYFLPDRNSGRARFRFPYTWSLLRSLGHFHVAAKLRDRPWYQEFYETDHPGNGLDVTNAILLAFRQSALDRGQAPVITVIPSGLDLRYYKQHGEWVYQNLLDRLRENGVDALNFGEGLMERVGDGDPCALLDYCNRHFNERGYRYLAEIAHEELEERGLLPLIAPRQAHLRKVQGINRVVYDISSKPPATIEWE